MKPITVYLDTCCYNRPFDVQVGETVRNETVALLAILDHIRQGSLLLIGSDALRIEISRTPNQNRRLAVQALHGLAVASVGIDPTLQEDAKRLKLGGLRAMDALHFVCALKGRADFFLSCDHQLCNRARGILTSSTATMQVMNPVDFHKLL